MPMPTRAGYRTNSSVASPWMTDEKQAILDRAPRLGWRERAARAAGQAWNSPNTALGLLYGAAGYGAGAVRHTLSPGAPVPSVAMRDGRVAFLNNPGAGRGALTLGEATLYGDDPWSAEGRAGWSSVEAREQHSVWTHEAQHVRQGRMLGPAYLPSNVAGGLAALVADGDWHGPHNWNEVGPQMHPARPWRWSRP